MENLAPLLETGLVKRDFDRGRRMFGEASCFSCHRFDNEGGAQGPDLTGRADVEVAIQRDPGRAPGDRLGRRRGQGQPVKRDEQPIAGRGHGSRTDGASHPLSP